MMQFAEEEEPSPYAFLRTFSDLLHMPFLFFIRSIDIAGSVKDHDEATELRPALVEAVPQSDTARARARRGRWWGLLYLLCLFAQQNISLRDLRFLNAAQSPQLVLGSHMLQDVLFILRCLPRCGLL